MLEHLKIVGLVLAYLAGAWIVLAYVPSISVAARTQMSASLWIFDFVGFFMVSIFCLRRGGYASRWSAIGLSQVGHAEVSRAEKMDGLGYDRYSNSIWYILR